MTNQIPNTSSGFLPRALIAAYLGAIGALSGWFVTHLPMVGLPESAAVWGMRAVWLAALALALAWQGGGRGRPLVAGGVAAGVVSGVVCAALIAGTKSRGSGLAAVLGAAGWLIASGVVLGLLAGMLVSLTRTKGSSLSMGRGGLVAPEADRSRFALVTAGAIAPLIVIGGLVTSTDSGMAVPDWPTTFGANMLAYPLNAASPGDVFLEHSHRLFGMLVGFAGLTLLAWVVGAGVRGWALGVTVAAVVLLIVQGVLGGVRVTNNSRALAMIHGSLGQGVFAVVIALAAYLSPGFAAAPGSACDPRTARRIKAFATALLHALVLQLLLGAMTRHFRGGNHALWTHAGFSIIVMVLAVMAGSAAASLPAAASAGGVTALRRCGRALNALAGLQFLLGWAAFAVRGRTIKADDALEALVRTAHQANGALLLGVAACTFVWARWLWRAVGAGVSPAPAWSPAPAGAAAAGTTVAR